MPLPRTLRTLLGLPLPVWLDLLRAAAELALARYRLGSLPAQELLWQTRQPEPIPAPAASLASQALAARIAFAIPRVAARLPFRADCFIQAMAARRWLLRKGIASSLTLGTRLDAPGGFAAHAWLTCQGRLVTGGDIRGYVPLGPRTSGESARPAAPD